MGALLLNIGVARGKVIAFLASVAALVATLELTSANVSLAPYFAIGGVNLIVRLDIPAQLARQVQAIDPSVYRCDGFGRRGNGRVSRVRSYPVLVVGGVVVSGRHCRAHRDGLTCFTRMGRSVHRSDRAGSVTFLYPLPQLCGSYV